MSGMIQPDWTTYVAASLTPVVAVFGILIAYRQWRTAQNRLKLDLFDRRMVVYESACQFLANILIHGRVERDEPRDFLIAIKTAKWVFNKEFDTYLRNIIYANAVKLQALESRLKGLEVGEDRTEYVNTEAAILESLQSQFDIMDKMLASHLALSH
jgi:hypothetical protein